MTTYKGIAVFTSDLADDEVSSLITTYESFIDGLLNDFAMKVRHIVVGFSGITIISKKEKKNTYCGSFVSEKVWPHVIENYKKQSA